MDPEAEMWWRMHRNVRPQTRAMVHLAEAGNDDEARAIAEELMSTLEVGCDFPTERERHAPSRVLYAELCLAYLAYGGDPQDRRVVQARRWVADLDGPLERHAKERAADLALFTREFRRARSMFQQLAVDHPGEEKYIKQAQLAQRGLQEQRHERSAAAAHKAREVLDRATQVGRNAAGRTSELARRARERIARDNDVEGETGA